MPESAPPAHVLPYAADHAPPLSFHIGPRLRFLIEAVILVAITYVAYIPAMRAGFIWDDPDYVTENQTLRDVPGLVRIWTEPRVSPQYYPLTLTTFWVEYHVWGLRAPAYHFDNVLLQIVNALLLWLLLHKLDVRAAWLAAAIFAVHPVHVESVAWVTERKNLLSGCFYLLAMLAYLRSGVGCRVSGIGEEASSPSFRYPTPDARYPAYFLSLFLFVCALLSKTVACSLPAAILLLIYWKHGRIDRRDVWRLVPFFVVGLVLASATAYLEREHVGAAGPDFQFSSIDRCLIAGRALWFYAGKLVWPMNLTFIYPRWTIDARDVGQYFYPISAVLVIAALWVLRGRVGRGPLVAVLLFAGTLLPALGFTNVYPMRYSFVADHFQYLASIALIVPFACLMTPALRFAGHRYMRDVAEFAPALLLVPLIVLTYLQARIYINPEQLWRDTIDKNPDSWMAQMNLGHAMVTQGRYPVAMMHYREALKLVPEVPETHWDVGNGLSAEGKLDEAAAEFRNALRLDPRFAPAMVGLGNVYRQQYQLDNAVNFYGRALAIQPDHPQARYNLGVTLEQQGKLDEAIVEYERAVADHPDYTRAHYSLANGLLTRGRFAEAIPHYRQVISVYPTFAKPRFYLAECFRRAGDIQQAGMELAEAFRLDPRLREHLNEELLHPTSSRALP